MKIRQGFVSNSSSSSFVINKINLSEKQIEQIKNHGSYMRYNEQSDAWTIEEDEFEISGSTWMDNFSMLEYLEKINVDISKVKWGS